MTSLYVRLVKMGLRELSSVPETKIVEVAAELIISKNKTMADVPAGYKTKVKAELKARGYDENGDPLSTEE